MYNILENHPAGLHQELFARTCIECPDCARHQHWEIEKQSHLPWGSMQVGKEEDQLLWCKAGDILVPGSLVAAQTVAAFTLEKRDAVKKNSE